MLLLHLIFICFFSDCYHKEPDALAQHCMCCHGNKKPHVSSLPESTGMSCGLLEAVQNQASQVFLKLSGIQDLKTAHHDPSKASMVLEYHAFFECF